MGSWLKSLIYSMATQKKRKTPLGSALIAWICLNIWCIKGNKKIFDVYKVTRGDGWNHILGR